MSTTITESHQFILFFRAVNVSGKNLIKMSELKDILILYGFKNAVTYIQSGNILLKSPLPKEKILSQMHQLILEKFDLNLTLFIYTKQELVKILDNNPFKTPLEGNKVFITFLENDINSETSKVIQNINIENEPFTIIDNTLYFYLPNGMTKSKLNNQFWEQKLKMKSTGRNRNTIEKIVELFYTSIFN